VNIIEATTPVISDAQGLAFLRWLASRLQDQIGHAKATAGYYLGGSERLLSWVSHALADIERGIERRSHEAAPDEEPR
jgi:hypothetical protein